MGTRKTPQILVNCEQFLKITRYIKRQDLWKSTLRAQTGYVATFLFNGTEGGQIRAKIFPLKSYSILPSQIAPKMLPIESFDFSASKLFPEKIVNSEKKIDERKILKKIYIFL